MLWWLLPISGLRCRKILRHVAGSRGCRMPTVLRVIVIRTVCLVGRAVHLNRTGVSWTASLVAALAVCRLRLGPLSYVIRLCAAVGLTRCLPTCRCSRAPLLPCHRVGRLRSGKDRMPAQSHVLHRQDREKRFFSAALSHVFVQPLNFLAYVYAHQHQYY